MSTLSAQKLLLNHQKTRSTSWFSDDKGSFCADNVDTDRLLYKLGRPASL